MRVPDEPEVRLAEPIDDLRRTAGKLDGVPVAV